MRFFNADGAASAKIAVLLYNYFRNAAGVRDRGLCAVGYLPLSDKKAERVRVQPFLSKIFRFVHDIFGAIFRFVIYVCDIQIGYTVEGKACGCKYRCRGDKPE